MDRPSRLDRIAAVLDEAARLHEDVRRRDLSPVLTAVETLEAAFARGGKVLVFGNGGSAADAQHFAAELVGRLRRNRAPRPAIALSTDTSVLTAVANDVGYDRVFSRQIDALGRPGDVAVGISTSGRSANVLQGLEAARTRGLATIALTGDAGGRAGGLADVHVNVPHASAARVQEVQRTLLHAMCELIEDAID